MYSSFFARDADGAVWYLRSLKGFGWEGIILEIDRSLLCCDRQHLTDFMRQYMLVRLIFANYCSQGFFTQRGKLG